MLLVQLTGAQSTGKTTIVKKLLTMYQDTFNVGFIGEISRTFKDMGLINNIDSFASSSEQIMLTSELLLQYSKALMSSEYDLVIAERSPFCCYGYSNLVRDDGSKKYMDYQIREFIKFVKHQKSATVLTYYFPLNIPFEQDAVRNANSRVEVDHNIEQSLILGGEEYFTVTPIAVEDRLKLIAADINNYFKALV